MAEKFDVAARLAEGRPAVDNIHNYVWACHLLGYQNPDLTLHAAQVRDWYGAEDGLDLRALDADCTALEAAVAATENGLRLQDEQLAELPTAWHGRGADASHEFLQRHGEASAAAVAAVRTAADALLALRDNLWHMIDGKVAAAVAIDDRRQAERTDWLAAAQTVTTGVGDRAVASELIDHEVKPFVDNDIRFDWLAAMRTTAASIAASYDAATAGLGTGPAAMFEVPGDLGPTWTPPPSNGPVVDEPERIGGGGSTCPAPVVGAPPVAGAPAAPAAPLSAAPAPAAPLPATPAAPVPAVEPAAATPAMAAPPAMPSLGNLGGGMPGAADGFAGLGQQLADALGGLLNPAEDAFSDPAKIDKPPEIDEPAARDDGTEADVGDEPTDAPDDAEPDEDEVTPAGVDDPPVVDEPTADTADICEEQPADTPPPAEPVPPPTEPAPTAAPLPPPEPAAPPPSTAAAPETPCEIAADELPQVGQ